MLVDLLDLKRTDKQVSPRWREQTLLPSPTDLQGLLDAVSEERRLVLAVVKQDVKGHLTAHHVLNGGFDHAVEVSGRVGFVQHVVDLRRWTKTSFVFESYTNARFRWLPCIFSPAASADPV